MSYIAPPVAATFIVGLFWKKANRHGSFWALMFGFSFAVFAILSKVFDLVDVLNNLHFLYRTFWLFILCIIVHIIVSSMTEAPDADQVEAYTWKRSMLTEETLELQGMPWYQNYRILSVLLLIITFAVVGMFW